MPGCWALGTSPVEPGLGSGLWLTLAVAASISAAFGVLFSKDAWSPKVCFPSLASTALLATGTEWLLPAEFAEDWY